MFEAHTNHKMGRTHSSFNWLFTIHAKSTPATATTQITSIRGIVHFVLKLAFHEIHNIFLRIMWLYNDFARMFGISYLSTLNRSFCAHCRWTQQREQSHTDEYRNQSIYFKLIQFRCCRNVCMCARNMWESVQPNQSPISYLILHGNFERCQ